LLKVSFGQPIGFLQLRWVLLQAGSVAFG
jgi:hypothetical protein